MPEPTVFDAEAHRRLVAESLRRVPVEHDAEALERLGQATFADDLLGGGR